MSMVITLSLALYQISTMHSGQEFSRACDTLMSSKACNLLFRGPGDITNKVSPSWNREHGVQLQKKNETEVNAADNSKPGLNVVPSAQPSLVFFCDDILSPARVLYFNFNIEHEPE